MILRKVIIYVVAAVPILIILRIYIKHELRHSHLEQCKSNESCIRSCTDSSDKDNDKKLIEFLSDYKNFSEFDKFIYEDPCKPPLLGENFTILKDGKIVEDDIIYDWNSYCLEINEDELCLHVCPPEYFFMIIKRIYPYFMLGSIPFLILTLIVFGCISEMRNLHGKCLMSYVVSLTILYTNLILKDFYDSNSDEDDSQISNLVINYPVTCKLLGYTTIVSLFWCFFWLNVICYDIWITFRRGIMSNNSKAFIYYCAYAFGIPIMIVFFVFALNHFDIIPERYKNNIGTFHCCVMGRNRENLKLLQALYIYGPVTLLLMVNALFYGITAFKIHRVKKETKFLRKGTESKKHDRYENERIRFFMYLKLSIVMGIPWFIETLSIMLEDSVIMFIASIFNCMQGFIIFINFVWKPKVTQLLEKRLTSLSSSFKNSQVSRIDSQSTETSRMISLNK